MDVTLAHGKWMADQILESEDAKFFPKEMLDNLRTALDHLLGMAATFFGMAKETVIEVVGDIELTAEQTLASFNDLQALVLSFFVEHEGRLLGTF